MNVDAISVLSGPLALVGVLLATALFHSDPAVRMRAERLLAMIFRAQ
ncbi:hypothetical protein [Streptomyces californicus]